MAFSVCVEFGGYGTVRQLLYCAPAPLNAALVANEENAAKAECLELKSVWFWLGFRTSILNRSGL